MTPNEFCYWLQGRAELLPDQPPTDAEWKMIREHLSLVFTKVTPPKDAHKSVDDVLREFRGRGVQVAPYEAIPRGGAFQPNFLPNTSTC